MSFIRCFFGAVPNLVFIFFFLLIFFQKKYKTSISAYSARAESNYNVILISVIGGFFLDIFSHTYIAPSVILFIIIGIIMGKIQYLLMNKEDNYPLVYFAPLFTISFVAYSLLIDLCFYFLDSGKVMINFGVEIIFSTIYSLLIAIVAFLIFKKINAKI